MSPTANAKVPAKRFIGSPLTAGERLYLERPCSEPARFPRCRTLTCAASRAARNRSRSALRPVVAIEAAILYRFGEVLCGDAGGVVEIGDGAGDLQNAIVRAGAEAQFAHGQFQRALTGVVQRAEAANLARRKMRVVETPPALDVASRFDALAHLRGSGAVLAGAQLFVGDRWNLDVQIDAVEQRPAHAPEIAGNDSAGAAALVRGVAVEPARACVQ